MDRYHAKYTDAYGSEDITITNDGESLRTTIRGLQFVGTAFDSLEPFRDATPEQLQSFALHDGFMCACRIECQMPIPIQDHGNQSHRTLFVELLLGDPASNGALDREELAIVLDYNDQRFAGSGKAAGSKTTPGWRFHAGVHQLPLLRLQSLWPWTVRLHDVLP